MNIFSLNKNILKNMSIIAIDFADALDKAIFSELF